MNELILVEKDGVQLEVHPSALKNHEELGWKVVVPEAPAAKEPETPAEAPSKKGKTG